MSQAICQVPALLIARTSKLEKFRTADQSLEFDEFNKCFRGLRGLMKQKQNQM